MLIISCAQKSLQICGKEHPIPGARVAGIALPLVRERVKQAAGALA
jgi:hypothetical protein